MKAPRLSIIMPAYNAGLYIKEAIESLLAQTYENFELIVSDDASSDATVEIVGSIQDPRLKLLVHEKNAGLVGNRNRAVAEAKGEFIGVFDADDIAHPLKYEKQISFLSKHPEYGMIGCWARLIDAKGEPIQEAWKLPASPERIPACMLFRNYFVHSAMVYRRAVLPPRPYAHGFELVEDYKLHLDILATSRAWNLPEYLLTYRVHEKSAYHLDQARSKRAEYLIFASIMQELQLDATPLLFETWFHIKESQPVSDKQFLCDANLLLQSVYQASLKNNKIERRPLGREIFSRWLKSLKLGRNQVRANDLYWILKSTFTYMGRMI